MKSIKKLLAIIFASVCSIQGMWAERVAPTMPNPCVPDSGQTYALYNVESCLCISDYNKTGEVPLPIKVHIDGDNVRFSYTSGTAICYLLCNLSYTTVSMGSGGTGSGYIWRMTKETDNSFLISNSTKPSYYMGTNGGTNLYWGCSASQQVHWYFFNKEDGERYVAEVLFYNALNNNDEASQQYAARGWDFSYYENMYANRANYTPEELIEAAKSLQNALTLSASYIAPWWNEVPFLISAPSTWAVSSRTISQYLSYSTKLTLSAIITVDEPSTFFYGIDFYAGTIRVFVDGIEKRVLKGKQISASYFGRGLPIQQVRFYETLSPGTHSITWKAEIPRTESSYSQYYGFRDLGVMTNKNLVSVDLLRPGSLGTEVLHQVEDVKDVRRLKVKGKMNDDDWSKLKMMSRLQELDLTEAEITEIPEKQFQISNPDTTMQFLRKLELPEGLKKINHRAFYGSILENMTLPSTLETIVGNTFYESHLCELNMPDNLLNFTIKQEYSGSTTNKYQDWFDNMYLLEKVKLSKNLKEVPENMFSSLNFLKDVVIPEGVESVGNYAFYNTSMDNVVLPEGLKSIGNYAFYHVPANMGHLPSTLTSIGEYAFEGCKIDSLFVPNSVTSMGNYAFQNCGLKYAELGAGCYSLARNVLSNNSETLKTLKLYSPTVAKINTSYHPLTDVKKLETLLVPHYLRAAYKLDEYWYNAQNIVPFDYGDMDYIPIRSAVELGHERFGGQPSIVMWASPSSLSIYGDMEQKFQNITCNVNYGAGNYGMILNECENVSASGINRINYYMDAKKWYFVSLPFDINVNSIIVLEGTQYAIRYYDGGGRAANGKAGNWKNYLQTDIILAGTGFIMQTNGAGWVDFFAADTENKYGTLRTTEFNKTLAVNASETASNKGWNLVGNPYQCFYNNHCLNFTAPITVWNPDNKTYTAYSLTDDDYAIRPNEAFFVQCPNEEYNTIGFPLQGRQLTSVIESQNAVKAWASEAKSRQVVNLTVSNGEMEDMTRVVLNEEASMAYETSCDASKFMSMDGSVPQIYTLDGEGTWYAINERPIEDGSVALGFYAGQEGSYTISVTRCDAEKVFITDNLTGETTDITNGAYTFSAKAGTDNTRFTLSFIYNDPTAIVEIDNGQQTTDNNQTVYDLNGRQIVNGKLSNGKLSQGIYVIRQGKKASKVVVR